MKIKGITKRWATNTLLITALILFVLLSVCVVFVVSYYRNYVTNYLSGYATENVTTFFSPYVEGSEEIFNQKAKEFVDSFSDKGRMVASELYDSLDPAFRERSLRSAIRHISVAESGMKVSSSITDTESGRHRVSLTLTDRFGEVMSLSVTVASRAEAEAIKEGYLAKPDGVYKGIMFSLTGRFDYIS